MGIIVKLVGSGIGLVSESIHKSRSKSSSNFSEASSVNGESSRSVSQSIYDESPPPQYVELPAEEADMMLAKGQAMPVSEKEKEQLEPAYSESEEEGDEEAWALDEAADKSGPSMPSEETTKDANTLTDIFLRNHPPPVYGAEKGKLACPVILPQRRPRNKTRGFIRAYAPMLEDCGIDQETFLDFLKVFYHASKNSPWLDVINVAAGIVGFVPGVITMAVSTAVQFAVGVAMEIQSRSRTNTFLDRINNEFFIPRGLYCLILTYKPDSSATHASVDISQAIASGVDDTASGFQKARKNLKLSSGKTYGEFSMPESAPLIFPALDQMAEIEGSENVKDSYFKNNKKFINDYYDRRAQATYAMENPNTNLATPKPEFYSRYSDPTHPASSGSLISLLTGGHINPEPWKQSVRDAKANKKREWKTKKAQVMGKTIPPETGRPRPKLLKRILQKDVLYLMIVSYDKESPEFQAGTNSVVQEYQEYQGKM